MDEILSQYQNSIAEITFIPSSGGVFEVSLNGGLIFSKKQTDRFPAEGEIAALVAQRLGLTAPTDR